MNTLKQRVCQFFSDEQGATAIEYGLLVALISVVIIAAVTIIGTRLESIFCNVAIKLGGTGCTP